MEAGIGGWMERVGAGQGDACFLFLSSESNFVECHPRDSRECSDLHSRLNRPIAISKRGGEKLSRSAEREKHTDPRMWGEVWVARGRGWRDGGG